MLAHGRKAGKAKDKQENKNDKREFFHLISPTE